MASRIVKMGFSEATDARRSIRSLLAKSTVPDSTIIKLVENALLTVPSAFNNQSTRITILFNCEHTKLWSIVSSLLLAKVGEKTWNDGMKDRIANFSNSYGTIMFWDDAKQAEELKEHAPKIYKDKTDEWVQQSSGMHQYYLWVGLEALGLGANLQHYNPLIDEEVGKTWNVPESWKLRAQMVFGVPKEGSDPGKRVQKFALEQRLQVFGEQKDGSL